MIVSESHSFIYARVPKTGSTSVSLALEPYRRPGDYSRVGAVARRLMPALHKPFSVNFRSHPHWPLRAARKILPGSFFDASYKFTVVRDPLNWCISLHNHILQNQQIPRFAAFYTDVYANRSFDYFVSTLIDKPIPPQVGMIADETGKMLVDSVVRLENIDEEIQKIFNHLGISSELQTLNKGKYREPPEISLEAADIIKTIYKADYLAFGYSECGEVVSDADLALELPELGNWIGSSGELNYLPFMRDKHFTERPDDQRWYKL